MKKLKLRGLLSLLLTFTVFISYASPIFAAPEDENTDSETETVENTNEDENNIEVDNAVDVDLSSVQIGDQFKDSEGITYTVDDDAANIYVGSGDNQKHYETGSIDTFEITYRITDGDDDSDAIETWRKYIRLEDLCGLTKEDGTPICEIMDETDEKAGEFYLKRLYKEKIYESVHDPDNDTMDAREVSLYYRSYHTTESKEFRSILQLVDENDEVIDTYVFDSSSGETPSGAGQWEVVEDEDGKTTSIMATDIETLIDNNDDVYVSLRFVSESLGAEVRWVSEEDSKDGSDDDVYIEFYDDKEYCKDIEFTFTSGGEEKDPKDVEKSLYTKETAMENISLDGTYTYTDNDGERRTSTIEWKKVYILLTIPENYPDEFFDNYAPLGESVVWIEDSGENYLRLMRNVYGKYSGNQCEVGNTNYDCDLGEEVSITGIILYKGVPIPIDLFNINSEACENSNP